VIRGPAIITRRSTPPPRHPLHIPLRLHPLLASNARWPPPSVPSQRKMEKGHAGCGGKRRDHVEIRTHRLSRPLPVAGVAVTHPTAAQPDEPSADSGGKSCDPPSCRAEACGRCRRACGETVRQHSPANASENSCLTPSVTVSNSPGSPSNLPRHMAPASAAGQTSLASTGSIWTRGRFPRTSARQHLSHNLIQTRTHVTERASQLETCLTAGRRMPRCGKAGETYCGRLLRVPSTVRRGRSRWRLGAGPRHKREENLFTLTR